MGVGKGGKAGNLCRKWGHLGRKGSEKALKAKGRENIVRRSKIKNGFAKKTTALL